MNTNGRSIFVVTSDQRRGALWERIFGTDSLPVLHDAPRWQERQGRAVLAYDLDVCRLSEMQRARFASHLSKVQKRPYAAVLNELHNGLTYPINHSLDLKVLEPAEQTPLLASFFDHLKRPFQRLKYYNHTYS